MFIEIEILFGQASCTLEAGVKIYSLRVDSVHSEAYKVLGGMNRAGQEAEEGFNLYTLLSSIVQLLPSYHFRLLKNEKMHL